MHRRSRRGFLAAIVTVSLVSWGSSFVSAQAPSDSGPDREWRFIEQLRADGMVDVAAGQLQEFARNYGDDPRAATAWLSAGGLHEELGQPEEARRDYEALLSRYPSASEAPRAALRRADLLHDAQRFEDAANAYRSLLEAYPAAAQVDAARLGLGESLMALKQDASARSMLRLLIAGRADVGVAARARYDLGILAERADSDSLAVERFDSVAELHPDQPIAGFALLRAAALLRAREEPTAARDRYESVLRLETAPLLRGRARLGLAELLRDRDPKAAMAQYEQLAKEGASEPLSQQAYLALSALALREGDRDRARRAARDYLESFPEAVGVDRARLLEARSDLGERDDAVERLRQLQSSPDRSVAWDSAIELADWFSARGDFGSALRASREAESAAVADSQRAVATLRQARAAFALGEAALAADLAQRSVEFAPEGERAAAGTLLAVRSLDASGQRGIAIARAEELLQRYPLTPAATEGRDLLRTLRRRANLSPASAAQELAQLAARPIDDASLRHVEIGRILRQQLGDPTAALESFRKSLAAASTPGDRARAGWEIAQTLRGQALESGLAGGGDLARTFLREARGALTDAAAVGAAQTWGARARVDLIGLDLAEAARPDAPWLFDADHMPLLGAVGPAESMNRTAGALDLSRERIGHALEDELPDDARAWLLWRQVELSDAPIEAREATLKQALGLRLDLGRQLELRYTLGQILIEKKDAAGAARQLSRILDEAPTSDLAVAARYGLAEVHRSQKNYGAAAELYLAFASAYPQSVRGQRALLLAGDCAFLAGDPERAIPRYRQLIERYPDTVYKDDALYRLGTALQRSGKVEAARESLRQLLVTTAGSDYEGRALVRLSQIEEAAGQDSLAVQTLRRLKEVDPKRAIDEGADTRIARLELAQGHYDLALSSLPDSSRTAQARAIRVRALAGSGRRDRAFEEWEALRMAAVDEAGLVAELRCELGEAQASAGETEAAKASFEFVVAESRNATWLARAHYQQGVLGARAGDLDLARGQLEAASRAKPTSTWTADALYQLGSLQMREGQPELAEKSFARLFGEFPRHARAAAALSAQALALRRMSRFDDALDVYHTLLEQFPDYDQAAQVLSNVAYCHHELRQYEIAIEAYRRVMPYLDEEGQAYAQFWIADSLAGLDRYEDAAAAFLKIPYLYPKQGQLPVTAQLKAAEVYERMQNRDSAVTLYQKVLRTHGANSQWGAEAQRRLDRLTGGESEKN